MDRDKTELVEMVRKTPEYQAIIDLGLEDITTPKNAKNGSIFFKTCLPATTKGDLMYEYSIYKSGYLRLMNPISKRYGVAGKCMLERNDVDEVIMKQYLELLRQLVRIYNRKAKKEGLFEEIAMMESIENVKLPLYTSHKWKFDFVKKLYLERLKTGNRVLEQEIA